MDGAVLSFGVDGERPSRDWIGEEHGDGEDRGKETGKHLAWGNLVVIGVVCSPDVVGNG